MEARLEYVKWKDGKKLGKQISVSIDTGHLVEDAIKLSFLDETSAYLWVEQVERLEVVLRIKGRNEGPI